MPQKPTISSLQVQLTESDNKMEKIQDLFIKFADKQTDLAQAQAALKSEIDNSIIPAIADINNKAEERHKRTEDFFTKLGNKLEENSRVIASLSSRQPPVCEGDAQAVEVIAKQAVAEAVAGASDEGQNPVVKKRMDELVMQVKNYEQERIDARRATQFRLDSCKMVIRGVTTNGGPRNSLAKYFSPDTVDLIFSMITDVYVLMPRKKANGPEPRAPPICLTFQSVWAKREVSSKLRTVLARALPSNPMRKISLDDYTPQALSEVRKELISKAVALKMRLGGDDGPIRAFKTVCTPEGTLNLLLRAKPAIEKDNDEKNFYNWAPVKADEIDSISSFEQIKFEPRRRSNYRKENSQGRRRPAQGRHSRRPSTEVTAGDRGVEDQAVSDAGAQAPPQPEICTMHPNQICTCPTMTPPASAAPRPLPPATPPVSAAVPAGAEDPAAEHESNRRTDEPIEDGVENMEEAVAAADVSNLETDPVNSLQILDEAENIKRKDREVSQRSAHIYNKDPKKLRTASDGHDPSAYDSSRALGGVLSVGSDVAAMLGVGVREGVQTRE